MTILLIISLILLTGLGLFLLWREGLIRSSSALFFSAIFMSIAVVLRFYLFPFESNDYLSFLKPWTEYFRTSGGFSAFRALIGNYNPPYMYFLALFSYINVNELYLIKLLSVVFDVLLAWSATRLLSVFCDKEKRLIICFFAVLFLPTVILNGAYWGQCDSIYSFFAVFSIYLALTDKPVASMFSLAAALAFKLQAVFVMPVFFVLLLAKKIRIRHLFLFPLAYIIYMLPAAIGGMPLWDAMTVYFSQIGTVGDAMNYNAPSLTAMVTWYGDTKVASDLLIVAAFLFVAVLFAVAIMLRKKLDSRVLFSFAVLFAIGIPYLLPHMHDRYFYTAGALLVVLAASELCFSPALIAADLASLHCYYAYLSGYYIVSPAVGAVLMLFSLVLVGLYLLRSFVSCGDLVGNNQKI